MKLHSSAIILLVIFLSAKGQARGADLFVSKYYIFQSNLQLNAHLFLYSKAVACQFAKVPDDSLAHYAFKDKSNSLSENDIQALNNIILFYKDSLLRKDLLSDSLMRIFSDDLSSGVFLSRHSGATKLKTPWQNSAYENIKLFQPYFTKLYWFSIDSANKAWLNANRMHIAAMEAEVVHELEKIYKTNLPVDKIKVDLTCYATWAGAYSFNDSFCHVIFATCHKSNQGELATEVLFHETSHFLVEKLMHQINMLVKSKQFEKELNLWHDLIFYTTGSVLEKYYKLKWQKFEPFYVQMKFQEKFPSFKNSLDACRLHWDPYLNGQVSFDLAISNLVNYLLEKQ